MWPVVPHTHLILRDEGGMRHSDCDFPPGRVSSPGFSSAANANEYGSGSGVRTLTDSPTVEAPWPVAVAMSVFGAQRSGLHDPLRQMTDSSTFCENRQLSASGNRLYVHEFASTWVLLWLKLQALNPLLLLDLALPILHPASRTRVMWDVVMLCVVLYVAVVAPLKISFSQVRELTSLRALDWTVMSLLSLDIIVNFRTAYITPRGEIVRDSKLIAARYIRGLFLLDVLAAIPFSIIFAQGPAHAFTVWLSLLKLTPLVRLVRLIRGSGQVGNAMGMARLVIFMLLIAHWACCFWHFLSEALPEWPWMFTERCATCSPGVHYLIGFYSSFLLLLGDRPDTNNNLERAVVTCLLFMGTLLYAVVMGTMTLLVANMFAIASRHKQRAAMVDDALRYRGVSPEVRAQVGEYYAYLAQFQHPGSDGVAFLQELPVGLYGTVMSSMFGPRLARVQLFANCERPFVWRLAQKLRLSLYMTGDTIYEVDSVGHDMYIVWKGAVALVAPDGCMAAMMCGGDHFGELGLMTASTPRPHRAVALRPSDVMLLSRWDLQDAMKDYPESAAMVKERARRKVEDHEAHGNMWTFTAAWDIFSYDVKMLESGGLGPYDSTKPSEPPGSNAVLRRRLRQVQTQQLAQQQPQQQQQESQAQPQGEHRDVFSSTPPPLPAPPLQEARTADEGSQRAGCEPTCPSGLLRLTFAKGPHAGPLAESLERLAVPSAMLPPSWAGPRGPDRPSNGSQASGGLAAATGATTASAEPSTPTRATGRFFEMQAPTMEAPPARGLAGLGVRLARILRGREAGERGARGASPGKQPQAGSDAGLGDDEAEASREDSALMWIAPSGLSFRAPSVTAAQARASHTHTTALQRRMLGAPTGASSRASVEAAGEAAAPDTTTEERPGITDAAAAGGDGASGSSGLRPHSNQGSREQSAAARPERQPLARQKSRQMGGQWADSLQLEDVTEEEAGLGMGQASRSRPQLRDGVGGTGPLSPLPKPQKPGGAASATKRNLRNVGTASGGSNRSLQKQRSVNATTTAATATAAAAATLQQPQHPLHPDKRRATGQRRRSAQDVVPLSPVVEAPPPASILQPQPQQPAGLPSLEDIWRQIQEAAATVAPAVSAVSVPLGGSRPASSAAQHTQTPPAMQPQSSHLSGQTLPGYYRPLQGPLRRTTSQGMSPAQAPTAGSSVAAAAVVAAAGQLPHMPNLYRQGSIPKLYGQGSDVAVELTSLTSGGPYICTSVGPGQGQGQSLLGPFMVTGLPGLASPPVSCSPLVSATGYVAPPASTSCTGHRTGMDPSAAASPAPTAGPRVILGSPPARALHNAGCRAARSSAGYSVWSGALSDGMSRRSCGDRNLEEAGADDDDEWSSDSSAGESRRRAAAMRQQLAEANARILLLEAQLRDWLQDPGKVPSVTALVQGEVQAALSRAATLMDSNLAALGDMLKQTSARMEDLSQQVAWADDRLKRLEQDPVGLEAAAGGAAADLAPRAPTLEGSVLGISLETISAARLSHGHRISTSGGPSGPLLSFNLGPELPGSSHSLTGYRLGGAAEALEWRRSSTMGAPANLQASVAPGVIRRASTRRGSALSQTSLHGILKASRGGNNVAASRLADGGLLGQDWLLVGSDRLAGSPQINMPLMRPDGSGAAAATGREGSVRRGNKVSQ